jgi:hypothetical protein
MVLPAPQRPLNDSYSSSPGVASLTRRDVVSPPWISYVLNEIGRGERLSGRGVLAFISNRHVGPDIEIELFLLRPETRQTLAAST